jgi:hypothetical protein
VGLLHGWVTNPCSSPPGPAWLVDLSVRVLAKMGDHLALHGSRSGR